MTDPRGYVRRGEPLAIAATQVNFLNRLMAADTSYHGGPLANWSFGGNILLVKNTTAATVERWGVLKIAGIEIDPNTGDNTRRNFESMPCVRGAAAATGESQACVVLEPIKAGKIGRAAVAGVVQIKTDDVAKLDSVDELWRDGEWALVRFGGIGVRLGTISATWLKGQTAAVTQIKGDGSALSPTVQFVASNFFATITVSSGTKKVACAKIGATWVLIAAEC